MCFSASYADSSFDVAISGFIQPCSYLHTTDALGEICRILKPSGNLAVIEPVNESSESGAIKGKDKLISTVKLSGFVDISQVNCDTLNVVFVRSDTLDESSSELI